MSLSGRIDTGIAGDPVASPRGGIAKPRRLQSVTVTRRSIEREAVIAGSRTRWWEYEPVEGHEPAPGAIVVVHGFRGDHHGLKRVIELLPGHRFIAPDLPGYGGSAPLPREHSVRAYADWLIEFASATSQRPFVVLGHSFGTIVTATAIDRGLQPDRTILINPIAAPPLAGAQAIGGGLVRALYALGGALPRRWGERLLRSRLITDGMSLLTTTTRDRELRRWIREEHRRYFSGFRERRVATEGFEASLSDYVTPHAAALTMPTLLIGAARDQITPVRDVEALRERIPGAELVLLEDVGHLIHYERPEDAAAAIRAFLAARIPA